MKTNTPQLRFPEFRNASEWEDNELEKTAVFINEKVPVDQLTVVNYTSTENILPDYQGYTVASKLPSSGNATRYKKNDILISNIRPYLKKVCIADQDGGASNDVIVVRAKNKICDQFLSVILRNDTFIDYVMTGAKGLKMPRGDISLIKKYSLTYPHKAEQQKIADCLASLDQTIGAETGKLKAYQKHKKWLMQQLFPADGETVPPRRFPEFRNAPAWEKNTIGQIAKVTTGNKDTQDKKNDGLYPFFVRSQTVERINTYSFDGEAILTSGDGVGVGKNFHYINGKFDFHQRVYSIYGFSPNTCGKFVYLYFSEFFHNRVMKMSAKNSVDSVRMAMITEMPIYLPCLNEQQKIADCLSSLDELIAAQMQKIERLKIFKKGMMQRLFPIVKGKINE